MPAGSLSCCARRLRFSYACFYCTWWLLLLLGALLKLCTTWWLVTLLNVWYGIIWICKYLNLSLFLYRRIEDGLRRWKDRGRFGYKVNLFIPTQCCCFFLWSKIQFSFSSFDWIYNITTIYHNITTILPQYYHNITAILPQLLLGWHWNQYSKPKVN